MQINIDKKTGIFIGIIILLLGVIGSMAITGNNDRHFFGMHNSDMMDSNDDQNRLNLTGADIMFLQMMIPHHQQAVDISELAISRSKDGELIALATAIRDGQSAEIVQMKNWLLQADADLDMGHSMGQEMGGMLTETDLANLNAATGKTFDLLWLQGMIDHHDGALHMSTMIRDAKNPQIRSFGENIVTAQTAQIEQMNEMIKRLG